MTDRPDDLELRLADSTPPAPAQDYGREWRRSLRELHRELAIKLGFDAESAEELVCDHQTHRVYTYRDLVRAFLDAETYTGKHPDLDGFHSERFRVLTALFELPDGWARSDSNAWGEWPLRSLFRESCAIHNQGYSPFQYFLEAPVSIHGLYQSFGRRLSTLGDERQQILFDLMCEIFAQAFGRIDRSFTSDDLRSRGFDDSDPPDPVDYL